jgi:hypothetical protein
MAQFGGYGVFSTDEMRSPEYTSRIRILRGILNGVRIQGILNGVRIQDILDGVRIRGILENADSQFVKNIGNSRYFKGWWKFNL